MKIKIILFLLTLIYKGMMTLNCWLMQCTWNHIQILSIIDWVLWRCQIFFWKMWTLDMLVTLTNIFYLPMTCFPDGLRTAIMIMADGYLITGQQWVLFHMRKRSSSVNTFLSQWQGCHTLLSQWIFGLKSRWTSILNSSKGGCSWSKMTNGCFVLPEI